MGIAEGFFKVGHDLGKWRRMWRGVRRRQKKKTLKGHISCIQSSPLSIQCVYGAGYGGHGKGEGSLGK